MPQGAEECRSRRHELACSKLKIASSNPYSHFLNLQKPDSEMHEWYHSQVEIPKTGKDNLRSCLS